MATTMGDDENFNEVLYSIQSLNVASNLNQNNVDHISIDRLQSLQFEGGQTPLASSHMMMAKNCDERNGEKHTSSSPMNFNGRAKHSRESNEMTQIKINVGIDEDLRMILEMDPSLMDEGVEASSVNNVVECPKVIKLPPKV